MTSSIRIPNYTLPKTYPATCSSQYRNYFVYRRSNGIPNPISTENGGSTVWAPGLSCRTAVFAFLSHFGFKKRVKVQKNKWRFLKINISDNIFSYEIPYYSRITSYFHPQRTNPDSLSGAIWWRGGKYSEEHWSNWSTTGSRVVWLVTRGLVTTINLSTKRRWEKITFHDLNDQVTFSVGCSLQGGHWDTGQSQSRSGHHPLEALKHYRAGGLLNSKNVIGSRTSFLWHCPFIHS